MKLTSVYEEYVRFQTYYGYSKYTIKDYGFKIKRIFIEQGIGDIEIEDLTVQLVMDYIISLRDRDDLAQNTVSSYIKTIRAFLNWTYENEYSAVNWLKQTPKYKQYKVQKQVFRDDEIVAIFASIKGHSQTAWLKRLLFALALDTGARVSELLSIRVSDVNTHSQSYVTIKGTKGYADRTLPLSHATYQIYQSYMIVRPQTDSDFLLINTQGLPLTYSSVASYVDTNIKGIGIKRGNMHYFRHTRITRWLLEGYNTMIVMMWAAHSKPETTNNYWHYSQELQMTGTKFKDVSLLLQQVPLPQRRPKKKR